MTSSGNAAKAEFVTTAVNATSMRIGVLTLMALKAAAPLMPSNL